MIAHSVVVAPKLPPLKSGNEELDRWVEQYLQPFVTHAFEHINGITPEAGEFTPAVRGSSTAGTYELQTARGRYHRLGDVVFASIYIQLAAVVTGGGAGNLNVTGLPFAKLDRGFSYYPLGACILSGVDITANTNTIAVGFDVLTASSTLVFTQTIDNGANVAIPISAVAADDFIVCSIVYEAGTRAS